MFETLSAPEADKIIRLMAMFRDDPRPDKVDLGVGVYRTPDGRTPVMAAVKQAEHRIWQAQETKGYVGLAGDPAFLSALRDLVLGDAAPADRIAAAATPGGTGAVRQVLELVQRLGPGATLWLSDPTWPNHTAIAGHLGLRHRAFRYYDAENGALDRVGMLADLARVAPGDIVLLHGCCHNPTGVDPAPEDWHAIGALLAERGAIPFIDMAYLGFGDGLEADAAGTRHLAGCVPEMFVAVSCSKNFGLYRDRVGAVLTLCGSPEATAAATGLLANLNRQNFAFPPDHGARAVETVLSDAALRASWQDELSGMRATLAENRRALARALRAETNSDRFGFVAAQRGMFSLLPATPDQVAALRTDHGIYLVGDGRINVAGLTPDTIPRVARAVAAVLGAPA